MCPHCDHWFALGYSVCPVCQGQAAEHHQDRLAAERALAAEPVSSRVRPLLARRMVSRLDTTAHQGPGTRRRLTRNPHRLEAYALTGIYFAEDEARELLTAISTHRWLEAEKAGRDIWIERDPHQPWHAAARDWIARHFRDWFAWRSNQVFETC